MGKNFRDMLARMPYEVRLLFRSVRTVDIASDIRPAYASAFRGAIYLDPAYVAFTPEQRAAITDVQDYRRNFGRDLQFQVPWRFVRDNRWMRAHSGPDGSRSIETLMPFLGYLLLHELAHAADYIHPDRIADFFDSENNLDTVMMSFLFRLEADVAVTDKGSDPDISSDNVVAWGQCGRIGDPAVVHRVRSVVQTIYSGEPDILGSLEHYIDNLPAPRALRAGETWLENVVLGTRANQAPPDFQRPAEAFADDVLSTRLPQ